MEEGRSTITMKLCDWNHTLYHTVKPQDVKQFVALSIVAIFSS